MTKGGGAFLHFMNLFLLLLSSLHAVKQNDNMYV